MDVTLDYRAFNDGFDPFADDANRRGRAYLKEVQRMNSTRLPVAIRPARAWATSPAIAFPV